MSTRAGSASTHSGSMLWATATPGMPQQESFRDARRNELGVARLSEEEMQEKETQLRANLKLLQRENGRLDANLARRIARTHFNLWSLGLRKTAIADTRAAYEVALSFPGNRDNPNLFLDCALVYMSFGAFGGALELLNRIVEEFPKFEGIARVLQIRASLWVRLGRATEAVTLMR